MTESGRGTIVVTGASTGIGRAAALHLAELGFHVFAGVRKETDGTALQETSQKGLTPIILDVTDAQQIASAAEVVSGATGEQGLAGLLNNAGVSVNGPLEFTPLDDLRHQLEVNVIGQVAVTQAFLPLIRKARGRIVNIGSIAGRMAMVLGGPYSASKFAIEAVTDTLRMELRPWGIEVIVIEPGAVATPIWEKAMKSATERLAAVPPETLELYSPLIEMVTRAARKTAKEAVPADAVSKVVAHAFTAPKPRTRYIVGRDAKIQKLLTHLPDRWRDSIVLKHLRRA